MKTIIIAISLLFGKLFAQEVPRHFRYQFKTAAYIQLTILPTETKVFTSYLIWNTICNSRFVLLYLEEVKTESDIEGGIEKVNWNDTLLFDLETYKLYSANERKCYQFLRKQIVLNKEGKFISGDTLIDCGRGVPDWASPTPTLRILRRGIDVYKTKKFTFKFLDEVKTEINIPSYYDRYRHFPFSAGKAPFAY